MNVKTSTKAYCLAIFVFLFQIQASAQDKIDIKFGKITPEDFDLGKHKFDTSAGAVYIADIGSSELEGNSKGSFSLIFKRQYRIKILSNTGFDAANESILVYRRGDTEEKLDKLSAITYNLEDGKVVATKLDEKSIFKDKLTRYASIKKFTLPSVKAGSIIEVSYTIKSDDLFHFRGWGFQGAYPRLWSEYSVAIPEFFNYVFLSQGYVPYHINNNTTKYDRWNVSIPGGTASNTTVTLSGNVNQWRWVMKDVPALKEERFTSSLSNYIAKIEFQLSRVQFPEQPSQDVMGNWYKVSQSLMKDEEFGATLAKNNNWLDDEMKVITAGAKTKLDKAKKIYAYVRDHFTCTDHSDTYLNAPLKSIWKQKNGSVADINLLLIAMLKHQEINAIPIILSTRSHGFAHDFYPLMDRYNYVIAYAEVDENEFFLDASEPKLGFSKLPLRCYNGQARLIDAQPIAINLEPDSLKEKKMTSVFVINDEKGKSVGTFTTNLGYYESFSVREKLAKGKEEYLKSLKTSYPSEFDLNGLEVDSLNNYDEPVTMKYNLNLNFSGEEDIVYFNPMMAEGYKDNYFKATERKYPVEMPYAIDETYVLNMEVPAGYIVDELPKSAKVAFNDDEGSFEYLIGQNGNTILLRSRLKLNKANFKPEDYEGLRGFFDYIVKKHNEQIVFKKKK